MIDKLVTDKQFTKHAGKAFIGGGDMLDKQRDGGFHMMIDELRAMFGADDREQEWSIEDYYEWAEHFRQPRPALDTEEAQEPE